MTKDFATHAKEHAIREPIAVLGLGRTGLAVADLFLSNNIPFTAWDDSERTRRAAHEERRIVLRDYQIDGLDGIKTLIPAAGIPPHHPVVQDAFARGIDIISDIDLLYISAENQTYIGITGTNGKSTTTALTGHILEECKKHAMVGGNIGKAALRLPVIRSKGYYVLELSSYQLFYSHRAHFDIAVLLNITPDHIDWHGSMANYIAAKESIFHYTRGDRKQTAIIGIDTPASERIYADLLREGRHHVIPLSTQMRAEGGLYLHNNAIIDDIEGKDEQLLTLNEGLTLRGSHNHQNLMAAIAVARTLGLKTSDITKAIMSFKGLAHRQQHVATIGKTLFINDSKATNFEAASKAITAYDNIHLILGGMAKEGGIEGIEAYRDHIRHCYLIGDAETAFAKTLRQKKMPFTKCQTMNKAVDIAFQDAKKSKGETVVMLSPACASFDQYANFEHRGDVFIHCVKNLEGHK